MSGSGTSIREQELHYDQAAFTLKRTLKMGETFTNVVRQHPTDLWTYSCQITPTGPVISTIRLWTSMDHSGSPMRYEQPVLEWLEFLDLEIEVATPAGTRQRMPVDLTRAVEVYAELGWAPTVATPPGEFQEGVYFRAVVPCSPGTGGSGPESSVLIQVELACAFRGPAADFDPPRAVEAAPFFPQFGVRAVPDVASYKLDPNAYRGTLTTFFGTVRLVADVDTPPEMRTHMLSELFEQDGTPATAAEQASLPAGDTNYVGLFTDMWNLHMNVAIPEFDWSQQQLAPILAAFLNDPGKVPFATVLGQIAGVTPEAKRLVEALWIAFFEYVERIYPRRQPSPGQPPPAALDKQFVGVSAADDVRLDRFRKAWADLPWPELASGTLSRLISKERRQGGYDSVHLHGTMGTVGNIDAGDPLATPRVMAPGCGHSCFHAHWRWGNTTYFLSACDLNHPDMGILQLVSAAALSDALVVAATQLRPDLEDVGSNVADWLWQLGPDMLKPPPVEKYLGWSSDGPNSRSRQHPGAPLIPPNQHLDIVIGRRPAGVGAALASGALDAAVKTVELRTTVYCAEQYSPEWRHCTTEFPVGVAVRYTESTALELFRMWCFMYFGDHRYLPQWLVDLVVDMRTPTTAYSPSRVFTDAYDVIPFLNQLDATGAFDAQRLIHATNGGTDPVAGASTLLEEL